MIQGIVTGGEAVVPLLLRGSGGQEQEIEVVVDTGFTSYLTLPHAVVEQLDLAARGYGVSVLADGSSIRQDVYHVTVVWHGHEFQTYAHKSEGGPLLGMALLDGSLLTIEAVEGGRVTIEPLP